MGYSERRCQICGISFNVGRIRTADEPFEAAWDYCRSWVVEDGDSGCVSEGCTNITRVQPARVFNDGSVREAEEICEHLAGSSCMSTNGYSGHRISVGEMTECTWVQCVMSKAETWSPEDDDEAFELSARFSWLTGISKGPPDEFDIVGLHPMRHGISETPINNCSDPDDEWGTPVHPVCFQMFKNLSLERFGRVALDELRQLWLENTEHMVRFAEFPESPDVRRVNQQFYECVPGTEYLVAHPIHIPGLHELIQSCHVNGSASSDVVFATGDSDEYHSDPFAALSPELKLMIISQLSRRDVANLRLVSRSFQQLPQNYFRQLVLSEMPWVSNAEVLGSLKVDWYQLWCKLSAADGGSRADEVERDWLSEAEWPERDWDKVVKGLSQDEKKRFGIVSMERQSGSRSVSSKQKASIEAIARERKDAGKHLPKATELKGLRNRRRIYEDLQEILQRIAALIDRGGSE